jgi:Protein of unknown function (DUF4197)
LLIVVVTFITFIKEKSMLKKSVVLLALVCTQSACAFSLNDLKGQLQQAVPQASAPTQNTSTNANPLANFSNKDQVASLKQALGQGIEAAVSSLAKSDGYLGNPKVRIPLPDSLQKLDGSLRQFGMGQYADELNVSMNRAAEAAVPEARALLVSAVKNMSVTDAKNVLMGGNDAATQYFRKTTESSLGVKFKPIVSTAMQKVQIAQKYDQFAGKGVQLGLIDANDANLESYITQKALDGLFVMMAEQEKSIRANPLEATGNLAKKVFGALKF